MPSSYSTPQPSYLYKPTINTSTRHTHTHTHTHIYIYMCVCVCIHRFFTTSPFRSSPFTSFSLFLRLLFLFANQQPPLSCVGGRKINWLGGAPRFDLSSEIERGTGRHQRHDDRTPTPKNFTRLVLYRRVVYLLITNHLRPSSPPPPLMTTAMMATATAMTTAAAAPSLKR